MEEITHRLWPIKRRDIDEKLVGHFLVEEWCEFYEFIVTRSCDGCPWIGGKPSKWQMLYHVQGGRAFIKNLSEGSGPVMLDSRYRSPEQVAATYLTKIYGDDWQIEAVSIRELEEE